MLLSGEKITKSYGDKPLLKDCSIYINDSEKIGVIGRNGAGKSTLLKILAQIETADSGIVTKNAVTRIGYLPQNPELDGQATVLEQVLNTVCASQEPLQDYEAKFILNKLGITDFSAKISSLSGGQKKRVAMASTLITPCEALILDEPTNHLDNAMITWLEAYLIKYTGAIIMVTHDRYFLDSVVSKIVEVDRGNLYTYDANYSRYLELKALREEIEIGSERKRKSILRKELEWISRGARARGTKSKSRIERYEELSERTGAEEAEKLNLSSISSRLGKKIIEINSITKSFGEKLIISNFEHVLNRDARIGIVGKNGCGKSTLLGLISGRISADSGSVVIGDTVKLGYFSQECAEMDLSQRVIDYVKSFGESIQTLDGTLSAAQLLEKFLFPTDLQWNTIGKLSGGERRRLFLLGILASAPNVLLFDEPTNDLDIETLMILEDYLENFSGAAIAVSHDRYFLDKVTDHIWEFGDGGIIKKHLGGYSEYLVEQSMSSDKSENNDKIKSPPQNRTSSIPKKLKFTFKEQREFETIDSEIALVEQKLAQIEKDLITQASDYEKLQQLLTSQAEVKFELEEKTKRWFYLQELHEAIEQQG